MRTVFDCLMTFPTTARRECLQSGGEIGWGFRFIATWLTVRAPAPSLLSDIFLESGEFVCLLILFHGRIPRLLDTRHMDQHIEAHHSNFRPSSLSKVAVESVGRNRRGSVRWTHVRGDGGAHFLLRLFSPHLHAISC